MTEHLRDTEAPVPSSNRTATIRPARRQAAMWLVAGVLVIALGAALKAMAAVAIPVVFALLVTLVMAPLHHRLTDVLPRGLTWLAHVVVMAVLLGVIAVFVGALVFAAERVLAALPDVSGTFDQLFAQSGDEAAGTALLGGKLRDLWNNVSGTIGSWLIDRATAFAQSVAGMTGAFVTALVIVFFLVLLALTELGVWRGKIKSLWPDRSGQDAWRDTIETITSRLRRFLLIRTGVGLLQAVLYVGWLAIFGVDLLVVWAVLTFLLTYIPNLGSVISGTLPVLYALLTKDFGTALAVAAGIFAIEQAIGNFVDPRLLGNQIVLSPIVILIAVMFWGWLWGAAGAFLATPITLSLLVAFNHLAPLRPLALMLSNQRSPDDLDSALDAC
ncbi:MAG: AI-2E family transporter [Pseudomonadota bacterium]